MPLPKSSPDMEYHSKQQLSNLAFPSKQSYYRYLIEVQSSGPVPVSGPNLGAINTNIPYPCFFVVLGLPSKYISPRGYGTCILLFCESCPVFCSPVTTVLFFPLILTSQCCLLHMSRLYSPTLHLVPSHAVSSFPLSSQSHPYMS